MTSTPSESLCVAVNEFQAVLTPTQNAQLVAHSTRPNATSILTFTAEVDRVNAHRRSRCVSSRLFGILQSVQDFASITDTLISAHPEIAALVWGAVKFTILMVNNITSFFDKLSECFLGLSNHCPRYSEYQLLFRDSMRLQNALYAFYTTVVNFCAKAVRTIENPGPTLAKAFWRPFEKEFGTFEAELRKLNDNVREEIQLASEQAAAREREDARKERNLGSLFRTDMRQVSTEARERRLRREQQKTRAEREELLEKISSYDYISPLKRIRKKRHGTTSSWLSKSQTFMDWFNDTKSSTLWLSGKLGSGKSVVTAAAIDELLCSTRKPNDYVCFFFCQYDNASSLLARTIVATLIKQCLSAETLSMAIDEKLKSLLKGGVIDADDLEPLLSDVAATSKTLTIIIDGLDECDRAERLLVLRMMSRLISSSRSVIRIFLSSRDDMIKDLAAIFDTCYQISMDCEDARADITKYVDDVIAEKIGTGELEVGSTQLICEARKALVSGANGMFLWVAFQVEDLCRQKSDAEIRESLTKLPKDLPETYERALSRIVREKNADIAQKIFRWVSAAKRPLRLEELREAIAVQPGDPYLHKDHLVNNPDRLIPCCGSLVASDEEDLIVQFVHHTAKDFLTSPKYTAASKQFQINPFEIDRMAGEICVTYLNLNDFQQ